MPFLLVYTAAHRIGSGYRYVCSCSFEDNNAYQPIANRGKTGNIRGGIIRKKGLPYRSVNFNNALKQTFPHIHF